MRHRPSRSTLPPPAALALVAACALSACSMFRGGGTPDNEPTLKTLANRKVTVDKEDVVAVNETKAIDAYRKFLDIAPQAPQRSEAMRRLGDLEMDSADSQSQGASVAASAAPDYKAAVKRYQEYLQDLSDRPEQRPRALPDGARVRAERRSRVGAEDARPAGQGLSGDALHAARPSSGAASCCSRRRTTPARRRRSPPCSARPTLTRTRTARSTCRAGRSTSRAASRTA